MKITKTVLDLTTPDGEMALIIARPDDDKPRPAILVIMEAFGVDPHIISITERFAEAGFIAVTPDLFHRSGRLRYAPYDKLQEMREELRQGFSDNSIDSDIQETVNFLQSNGSVNGRIGIVGFCLGGRISMQAAIRVKGLSGAAIFYGGNMFPSEEQSEVFSAYTEAPHLNIPLVGFFGMQDQNPNVNQIQKLENMLINLRKDYNFYYYENAGHGFFCNDRESYRPDAARDSWEKTLDFFKLHCPL